MSHDTRSPRTILHMDGDAFFVGVEVAKDPTLRGLPVVTGGERGIVTALSYEAKALGIVRGLPIFKVKKQYPTVIIMDGDYKSYAKYSSMMFDIVRRYADDVEEYSIDECFADLTGLDKPLKMSYREIAERIKREVTNELGLSVTIGVAPTKVLAKVASKWVKPNGLTIIEKDNTNEFLSKMPIGKIWGIGPRTASTLEKHGIQNAQQFVDRGLPWVKENFSKPYEAIWLELSGIYVMELHAEQKTKYSSIQKTRTFHPATNDVTFLLSQLSKHIEEACSKARHYHLTPKKFSIYLKDQDFVYTASTIALSPPTNAPEILLSLTTIHFKEIHKKGILYRTTGITLHDLHEQMMTQGDLFGNSDRSSKFEEVHKHMDALEAKYGKKMVHLGSTHKALTRKVGGTDADDLDRHLLFL